MDGEERLNVVEYVLGKSLAFMICKSFPEFTLISSPFEASFPFMEIVKTSMEKINETPNIFLKFRVFLLFMFFHFRR